MIKKRGYDQYLNEKTNEDIGMSGGIDSTNVVSIKDPVATQEDPFMGKNAPILNLYSTGDGFKIHDNSKLYEIIKLFKDLTDKHQYLQSLTYAIDVNNKLVKFTMVTENDHILSQAMLNGIMNMFSVAIAMKFGESFEIGTEVRDLMGVEDTSNGESLGKKQLTIIVKEKSPEKK